ncbi:MAG: hypothetical protein KF795_00325 [Labilithrix sp.]|nr:hypothetical protein [Labilithrix sp.]
MANDISWLDRFFVARTIEDDGSAVPQRPSLNFTGDVVVTDDETNNRTNVNVTANGGGGGSSTPTGTGFVHVTAGTQDAAARDVMLGTSDVSGTLPATKGGTGLGVADLALAPGEALVVNDSGSAIETASIVEIVDGAGVGGDVLTRSGIGAAWRLPLSALGDVGGRLTLQSGAPIPLASLTGQSVLFFTPHRHGGLALWNEARQQWQWVITDEIQLTLSGLTSGRNHDVFAVLNAGLVSLEIGAAWTNNTTRSEPLARRDGVLVKSTDHRRRYLGTLRATSSNLTSDSSSQRFLWNFYNRVPRPLLRQETADSWTYAGTSYRVANNNVANCVEFVTGDVSFLDLSVATFVLATTTAWGATVGLGFDATNVNNAQRYGGISSANFYNYCRAEFMGYPSVGYHIVYWTEISGGITLTFYGDIANGTYFQFGMLGHVLG